MENLDTLNVHFKEKPLIRCIRTKTQEVQYPNIAKEVLRFKQLSRNKKPKSNGRGNYLTVFLIMTPILF